VKGIDLEKIRDLVVDCFDIDEFDMFLRFKFDIRREVKIAGDTLDEIVYNTLLKAQKENWLPNLIAAVARERPRRPDVQAMYQHYAVTLIDEASRKDVDESVKKAYGQFFGDRPPVVVEKAGAKAAVVPAQDAGLERTLRQDLGFLDAAVWMGMFARMQGRVCQVELNDADDTKGTGFLVGPDAILTNYHVLEKVITAKHAANLVRCRFDFRTGSSDGILVELAQAADAARPWLLAHSPYSAGEKNGTPDTPPPAADELDFALVRLARPIGTEAGAGGAARGWVDVPTAQPSVAGIPLVMILQHPERKPLQLALDTAPNAVLVHGGRRVRYSVNTEGGSSGSPVFDKEWKLIALHQYYPALAAPRSNQGIPIGLIRARLGGAALEALGASADSLKKLEAASAVAKALSEEFKKGTPSHEEVVKIAAQHTESVLSSGAAIVTMSEKMRKVFDDKIDELESAWAKEMSSDNAIDWQKATDKFRANVCTLLKQLKQVNGGVLPDYLYQLWSDNGCS
jgi:hypothetical protein